MYHRRLCSLFYCGSDIVFLHLRVEIKGQSVVKKQEKSKLKAATLQRAQSNQW